MAILITDDGATIKVIIDGASAKYISKAGAKVHVEENNVIYTDNENNQYTWDYRQVSTPSSASADALATTVQGYLDLDASVAQQLTGNTWLEQLVEMGFGKQGYTLVTNTTAITGQTSGTYYCAVFPEDSVINLLTITGRDGNNENSEPVPANHVIYGDITAFALTSGSARLYKR